MSIKVEGFLKDVRGINVIMDKRTEKREQASAVPDPDDFVYDTVEKLHPDHVRARVTQIREASPTSRTYRFEPVDGYVPVFQSGQYANFRLQIGESLLTRPYSISSAPFEARGEDPFFEITIRNNRHYLVPDYFFENVKAGDVMDVGMPFGTFYWEPLRDTKNILALAGGSGITCFLSMAREIACGKMRDCTITILYGSVKADDIVLREELDAVDAACDRVRVIHVLSDEPEWEGEKGFITREIIEKYAQPDTTYMFCGPLPMYRMVSQALCDMGVPERRLRHDAVMNPADVTELPDYPKGTQENTYKITVVRGIQEDVISANAAEPVAVALERAAIPVDTHCRSGECGFCRSQLLKGDIYVSPFGDGRRMMDKEMGWFHPCSAWPLSDLKIKIPIL